MNNNKNWRILNSLATKKEKIEFMIGGRVTVGRLTQVAQTKEKKLVHNYHPKIQGIFVGRESLQTRDEAASAGRDIMRHWKEDLERINSNQLARLARVPQTFLKRIFAGG